MNLLVLRFANVCFGAVWNRQHIKSVQVIFTPASRATVPPSYLTVLPSYLPTFLPDHSTDDVA